MAGEAGSCNNMAYAHTCEAGVTLVPFLKCDIHSKNRKHSNHHNTGKQ
jgi:hypothetical protein